MSAIDEVKFWLNDDTLGDEIVQRFLDLEQVMDSDGNSPSDDDYTPTYDVLKAAGRGWYWKAGQIGNKAVHYRVGDVSVTIDKNYCVSRARELMGASSIAIERRDEQTSPDELARYQND